MRTAIYVVLTLLWVLDALRLRKRAAALPALTPSEEPVAESHRFLCAPGLALDEATRRAASAHARREKLDVVDLVPADLSLWRAQTLVSSVDLEGFGKARFAKGRSAGYAFLVDAGVLARVEAVGPAPTGPGAMFAWAARLKHHAISTMGFAVAPGLPASAGRDDGLTRRALLKNVFGDLVRSVLLLQVFLIVVALAGPFVGGVAGIAALAAYQLQQAFAFAGTALRPPGLLLSVFLRAPLDLAAIVALAVSGLREKLEPDPVAAARPHYQEMIAGGAARFLEPRRDDCPLCGSKDLTVRLRTTDILQHKPGKFTLERCRACQHIFQNPRLTIEGLNYYYGDFYDGLGEDGLEAMFGWNADPYLARARMLKGVREVRSWLDVGTGHGHFCLAARDVWPNARFDGLDLSESVVEAERRKWIDRGFRGLFPEMAPTLAAAGERYDVVSMSHYLEHTREPRAEIAAAHQMLDDGGLIFIELPDPESRIRHILGRHWISWFQPQHQHFLTVANLEKMLREEGFEPVAWHRGEAHQPVDFLIGASLALSRVLPMSPAPWRRAQPLPLRLVMSVLWWVSVPVLGTGWMLDNLLAPLMRRKGWSNTYRALARKVPRA